MLVELVCQLRAKMWSRKGLSVNALCELEAAADEPAGAVFAQVSDLSKARYSTWRALFWAALRDHHADISLNDAGKLMTVLGMTQVVPLVHRAVTGQVRMTATSVARGTSALWTLRT